MGLDVPDGAAPEQPREEAPPVKSGGVDSSTNNRRRNLKGLLVLASLGLLVVAGLLIGFLPDWKQDEDASSPVDGGDSEDPPPTNTSAKYYESSDGPFDVKLPLFSPDILNVYGSKAEVENDLEHLARFLLNDAITNNVASGQQRDPVFGAVDEDFAEGGDGALAAPGAPPDGGGADFVADTTEELSSGAAAGIDDSFETNNQEESVDRGDLAKSNGELIFVAYGNSVVVIRASDGEQVDRIEIPSIELPPGFNQGGGVGPPPDVGMGEPMMDIMPGFFWNPKPTINALLLEDKRLAVVASGYSMEHTMGATTSPIFWDFQNTKIHLYEFTDAGVVSPISSTTLNGSFQNAFSNDAGYIVLRAGINTWDHLNAHVQRWQERFAGLNDDEYLAAAVEYATNEVIPNFIASLTEALGDIDSIDLTKLSLYAENVPVIGNSAVPWLAGDAPNSVTYVVSFNMFEEIVEVGDPLTLDVSATFQPDNWGHVYAHEQMIIVAGQGWNWSDEEQLSAQYTYLLGFRLDGPTSNHIVVGTIPGHILSPYSIDFNATNGEEEGSYIRVATTQNFWDQGGELMFIDEVDPAFDDTGDEADVEEVAEEESTTLNKIFVLKFPDNLSSDPEDNVLTEVGFVELGEPNERFTTVRFFNEVAYAVTFERIDPFYVVTFEDPETPVVEGELKVEGFSEYLHPVNTEGTILAAIGQMADENGRPEGMQISLFGAEDPVNPILLDRLPINDDSGNSWSSSSVSWDPRAFRYVKFDEESGYLIMPLSTYTMSDEMFVDGDVKPEPQYFEGFVVFSIDLSLPEGERISEVLRINHTDSADFEYGFWYCSWLPERSFVIDEHLITMKSHTMVSTDLVSGTTEDGEAPPPAWTKDIDEMVGGCPMYRR